ncbi:DDE-type integrase/transposase/recombinase [Paenibacillus larvae]|uniref:DDE-type integrase/transposase/recombinase n=2 Tax=Paenibacillus larvae TaxID=1464 RepID=UPI0037C72506
MSDTSIMNVFIVALSVLCVQFCVVSLADHVLNRDFHATRPNEKWVTDITYIPYKQKNLYLFAICDLFNNEIIAFHLSTRNDLQLVIDTLEKARKVRKTKGVLLHSDQGYQYTSRAF